MRCVDKAISEPGVGERKSKETALGTQWLLEPKLWHPIKTHAIERHGTQIVDNERNRRLGAAEVKTLRVRLLGRERKPPGFLVGIAKPGGISMHRTTSRKSNRFERGRGRAGIPAMESPWEGDLPRSKGRKNQERLNVPRDIILIVGRDVV